MRTLSVRGLTEGAILAALVALLALAARYLPPVGLVSTFICPIPLMLMVIRHGPRAGMLAALVAAFIAWTLAGDVLLGAGILVGFAPMGLVIGMGVRRGRSAPAVLLPAALTGMASLLASAGLTFLIADVNIFQVMLEGISRGQEAAVQLYEGLGISREEIEQATGMTREILAWLPKLLPLSVAMYGAFTAYMNFSVGRAVLRKLGHEIPGAPPVTTWQVPAPLLWLLPLGFVLFGTGRDRYPLLETAGLNLTVLAQMLFSFQGLVVGWILLGRYGAPAFLRVLLLSFAIYQPVFGFAAFLLGLADSAFYLRRRWAAAGTVS